MPGYPGEPGSALLSLSFRPPGDLLATRLTWRDRQDDKKNS